MKDVLILAFGLGAILDAITTTLGIGVIIRATDPLGYAVSAGGAAIILAFGLGTNMIWKRKGFFSDFLKLMWVGAIMYDVYTSFIGNVAYVIAKRPLAETMEKGIMKTVETAPADQVFGVLALTLLFVLSPLLISWLRSENGDE